MPFGFEKAAKCAKFRQRRGDLRIPRFGGRLMLTIVGGISEFERGLMRKRCEEGIERAKRKGVTFGRKRKLDKWSALLLSAMQGRDDGRACGGLWRLRADDLEGTNRPFRGSASA